MGSKPIEEQSRRMNVSMPPDLYRWLHEELAEGQRSKWIVKAIEAKKEEDEKLIPERPTNIVKKFILKE